MGRCKPRARRLARPGGGRHKAFPQDERGRAPLALPLGELHDVVVTERAALKRGFTKGETTVSPFGIKLYIYPPPVRKRMRL